MLHVSTGLENIYKLTQGRRYELRVDLEDWEGQSAYAKYRYNKIVQIKSR